MNLRDEYLDWMLRDRNKSPSTVRRYRTVLARFDTPETLTVEQVEQWWRTRYHLAPATRENELACLRSFFKWCARFDHRADDPTRRLDYPDFNNAAPRPIGRVDLLRVLDACAELEKVEIRRAVCLGAYGGLRVSEAASLDWADVDSETRRLRIMGKGAKPRLCALSPLLWDEISPPTGGNVVRGGLGPPYGADMLQRKVNRFLKAQGLDTTFHKLRARYVTRAIAETGDIFAVAQAVGWSSIETAKHYAVVSDEKLDRIAEAASR